MASPRNLHHIAIMTKDMKGQLEFFTQVLGLPLVAIFDMHGVEGAWHSFVRLNDSCYLSFAQVPGVERLEPEIGVTHAGTGAGVSSPGTMQHLALGVADEDELLALRDRVRAAGIAILGPIDHGMCRSLYFAGPEQLTLEFACPGMRLEPDLWVDPAVAARAGISADDLDRFCRPPAFARPPQPVPQPRFDPAMPHLAYPEDEYRIMVELPDHVVTTSASLPDPPMAPAGS